MINRNKKPGLKVPGCCVALLNYYIVFIDSETATITLYGCICVFYGIMCFMKGYGELGL